MRLKHIFWTAALGATLVGCGGGGGGIGGDGGSLEGFLSTSDWVLGDGYYADRYVFTASRDGQVQVDMGSNQVDPYLVVLDEDGNYLEDDDAGPGDDARLLFDVIRGRQYEVRATTFDQYDTGDYDLFWSRGLVFDGELRGRGDNQERLRAPQVKPKQP